MEDLSNDDINYLIAKLSEYCLKSFFDNNQNDSQLLGIKLDEQLIKSIRDKEEMMKTMFDLLNYIFNKQQKILADYENLKIQGEHSLLVLKQEIQQNQYQIEQLQTLNEENQEKNQQFLDQIEELENQLQQKKSEVFQMKQNEGRISQNHQAHEIKSQEQKEELQSFQTKVQQLEENNRRFKSEAIASFNLWRQYEMKQKDYEDKIEILELQLKNNQREKEKLSKQYEELFKKQQSEIITSTQIGINNNFTHNSPQKSTRKNSTYSNNNNNHETIQKLRRQSGFLNQPKLEQIQKQINNIPESESESEDENQLNSGKTLKQEKNEKKNIQKELNNLKITIKELEKQKAEMEIELAQNKEMISNQDTKIRQLKTNLKKMNLNSYQLEKKITNLTEGILEYYFQRKMLQKILISRKNHQNKINQRNKVKSLWSRQNFYKMRINNKHHNQRNQTNIEINIMNYVYVIAYYKQIFSENLKEEDKMEAFLRDHESAETANKYMQKLYDQQLYQINLNQILNISDADLIFTRARSNALKKDIPIEYTEIFKKKLKEKLDQSLKTALMSEQNTSEILQKTLLQVNEYEQQLKKSQEENQKFKLEIDEQKKNIDLLNFKNKELENQNSKEKIEMIEQLKLLDQYKIKVLKSEEQQNLMNEKVKDLQVTMDQQFKDIKNLTDKNIKLQNQYDLILKQKEQQESEFNSINDINSKMEQTLQAVLKNYSDIELKCANLEIDKKHFTKQIEICSNQQPKIDKKKLNLEKLKQNNLIMYTQTCIKNKQIKAIIREREEV